MTTGRIKTIRAQKGLSQKELGERLGVSQQMIGQWETGKASPKIETLEKIAKVLDVDIFSLVGKEKREDNIFLKLETYMSQQSKNEMLSETGKWLAKRIIKECIKIVKSGGIE